MNRLLIFALVLIGTLSSCAKEDCAGFDTIIELENVFLFGDDTLQYFENVPNQFFGISLTIFGDYASKDGKRNCETNDLAFKLEDVLDPTTVSLKCDKILKSGNQTFMPNTELISTTIARVSISQSSFGQLDQASINLVGLDGVTQSENYKFTLIISTENNKDYTDDHIVYIKN